MLFQESYDYSGSPLAKLEDRA
jgi:hypothetical protein